MFNHTQSYKIYTDNNDSSYYSSPQQYKYDGNLTLIDHAKVPIFADSYFKGISCNNGIKTINIQGRPAYYDKDKTISYRTLTEYKCNIPARRNHGPVNNIEIQSGISDIFNNVIDCGNHPITYYNMNNGYIQYSCGNNLTHTNGSTYYIDLHDNKSNTSVDMFRYDNSEQKYYSSDIVEDENINKDARDKVKNTEYIMLDEHELHCSNDGVITRIQFTDPHRIRYVCKTLAGDNIATKEPNVSDDLRSLKTDNQKLIQKINVKTDDYRFPDNMWSDFTYSSIPIPLIITQGGESEHYDYPFVSVNCEGSAIASLSFEDRSIEYTCGGTPLTSLTNYEYTEYSSPMLYDYYDSGVIFDHVSCPGNSVLSGFSRTITKNGPKVKWICGVKK